MYLIAQTGSSAHNISMERPKYLKADRPIIYVRDTRSAPNLDDIVRFRSSPLDDPLPHILRPCARPL
jgi:hypothetical protein